MGEIQQTSKDFFGHKIKNVIVLGTGGSVQTLLALKHLSKKKLYPITSSRAVELKKCLDETTPEDSIVIPISRGGETLDVNSTIGIFSKNNYNFIGLSSKGTMYHMLEKIGCPILEVPDLTGRFAGSISNVGILPAFLLGINVNDFLTGLNTGYIKYMNFNDNPALNFSVFLYNLYKKGFKVVFSMPYSLNLEGSVGLFVQEISESTGKEEKGLIGTYQSAPLCQHSVLEYLLGGTIGAVIPVLWTLRNEDPDLILESSIGYVNKQTAQTIVNYQADATFQAILEQKVPSAKITIERPDEYNIGNLIAFIQSTVYYLCLLLDVNWSDNPKVITGKEIGHKALKNKSSPEQRKNTRERIVKNIFSQKFYEE
jgi:glucose-6-phosphate isomerase